ncbi:MAG: hypothetical protein ACI4JC_08870 [Faecalibacterium sp.]
MKNKLCRILALLLAAVMICSLAAPAFASESTDTLYIYSAEDLIDLAKNCTLDTWSQGKTVSLEADISLEGYRFLPIPSFGGTFLGNGHTISGFELTDSVYPAGLFGIVQESAVIKNLKVSGDVEPSGDANTLGGIAGINHGKIINCSFTGIVCGKNTVGGAVGLNAGTGQMINCSFRGMVTGEHYVGGIVGQNTGSLIRCINNGSINTTEVSVETDLQSLNLSWSQLNSTENIPAGTDIGGIAGFSTGLLQSCRNNGNVGYEHMGYNIGGIVGRQSGYLDGCVNMGTVLGRKDVGGIAGQLEPQVTLKYSKDTLSKLWDALDVMEDLMDQALSDAEKSSSAISSQMNGVSASVGTAKDTAVDLTNAMTEWANGNIGQINDVSARLSWMLDQTAPILDDLDNALKMAEIASVLLSNALDDTELAAEWGSRSVTSLKNAFSDLQNATGRVRDSNTLLKLAMTQLEKSLGDTDSTKSALKGLVDATADMTAAFSEVAWVLSRIGDALDLVSPQAKLNPRWQGLRDCVEYLFSALLDISGVLDKISSIADGVKSTGDYLERAVSNLDQALKYMEKAGDYGSDAISDLNKANKIMSMSIVLLQQAMRKTSDVMQELAEKPAIQFTPIDSGLTERGDALDNALSQMLEQVNTLNDTMSSSSDSLLADLRAINRQMGVIIDLMHQISEEAIAKEGSNHFEDVSDQELSEDRTSGQISNAQNSGSVNGDINVAGIVGSMAIEYDFDPEDDLSESGERSYDFRYQLAAVVRSCINTGSIAAKKDYAGGIIGRMDLGAAYLCQAYGSVESTNGDYVGGIAGRSQSAIRRCFAKCTLSGGRYVGGVLGSGDEDSVVDHCYTLVQITDYEQYAGAVAGTEDGKFTGNCFVSDELAGLGRVSYTGKAEPVSYQELCAVQDLPDPFKSFTLTFRTEDTVLKTIPMDYGASFDSSVYPPLPQKEGYYACWDTDALQDLHYDTVVTVVYTPIISAIASTGSRSEGHPIFFAEGHYDDTAALLLQALETTPDTNGFPQRFRDALPGCFTGSTWSRKVIEQWQIVIPQDGNEAHTIRYLAPDGDPDVQIYVRQEDGWAAVETHRIGSYLCFAAEGENVEIAVISTTPVWWVQVIAAALALLILIVILRLVYHLIRIMNNRRKEARQHGAER